MNLTPTTAEEIANAQLMLQGFGLYKGPINGILTRPTRAALRVFQSQSRLPVTGHLDLRTGDAMGLSAHGALGDARAVDQIEQLQTTAGLPVTGRLDAATLQVLREGLIPQENGLPSVRFRDTLPMAPVSIVHTRGSEGARGCAGGSQICRYCSSLSRSPWSRKTRRVGQRDDFPLQKRSRSW